MEAIVLAVLFGGALVYALKVSRHACKSDHLVIRHGDKRASHEL